MKIIASDFDGTINYNGKVSDEDKEAIKEFRKAGNKFGIVTGRDVDLAQWIKQENGFEFDFVICCTGGVIKDGDGKIIYAKKGKVDTFFYDLIEKARELGSNFFAIGDVLLKCYIDMSGQIPIQLDAIKEFTHANVGFPKEENATIFAKFVKDNYSDKISAYQNGWHVDMPPVGISKVTGVYAYASLFDNPEIYAVGDNVNDLPMIEEFNGFAVSNAKEEVKAKAKHQCNRICDMIKTLMEE
jgi:HAD superfamily hydrolase (TIGR01484 family)